MWREKVSQVGKNFPVTAWWNAANRRLGRGSVLAFRRGVPGSTLVELAIAVVVVAVLAAIGFSSARDEISRFRLMQAARLLHSDLRYLRSMAITTNRQTRLLLVQADTAMDPAEPQQGEWLCQVGNRSVGSNEWDTLPPDVGGVLDVSDGERSLAEGGTDEATGISLAPWPALTGPGAGNADAIVFSPRGWVDNPATDFADGYIVLELVNKVALDEGADQHAAVRLSRGGLAHLETGPSTSVAPNPVGSAEASSQ